MNKLPIFVLGLEIGAGLGLAVRPTLEWYQRKQRLKRINERLSRQAGSFAMSPEVELEILRLATSDDSKEEE